MDEDLDAVLLRYLAGVLNHSHSGGVESDVQSVKDVNHELPHGLKLMRPNAAGAVDEEDQIHRTRLTFLLRTWRKEHKQSSAQSCDFNLALVFLWDLLTIS